MTFWLVLSLMLVLAAALMAAPFVQPLTRRSLTTGHDLQLYREQLAELTRETGRGVVPEAEVAATRREIELRILASAKSNRGETMNVGSNGGRLLGLSVAVGWVILGSVVLYLNLGRPDLSFHTLLAMPQQPVSGPFASALPGTITAPTAPLQAGQAPLQPGEAQLPAVDSMITRLAARLENEPDDIDGWRMLGWSYFRTQNFAGAVSAYRRASALTPGDPDILSLLGEAMVEGNSGIVDVEALRVIDASLAIDASNPRATFFKALSVDQAGNPHSALEMWLALLDRTPADADWRGGLIATIRERGTATGFDLSGRPEFAADAATQPAPAPTDPAQPGPTQADIQAAGQMTAADRQAMIRGMVDGLAAKLAETPNDPDGWNRLIRSYVVLGDRSAAEAALMRARSALAGQAGPLAALDQTATELGL